MATSSAKVCVRCGLDCSAKQRTKDADGNYICGDCIAQAKARAPAPPPLPGTRPVVQRPTVAAQRPDPGADQGVLGKLIDESVEMHKHGCPNCHAPMKSSQILCVKCGFNKERGKQIQTVVKKALQEKGIDDSGLRRRKRSFISDIGPGIALAIAGVAVLALGGTYMLALNGGEGERIIYFGTHALFGFLTFIFVVVAAFMESIGKGFGIMISWIMSGVASISGVGFGGYLSLGLLLYIAYWIYVESESFVLQMMFSVHILSTIALVAMLFKMMSQS